MELITLGVGLVVNTFIKNKEVNAAVDDFVSDSVRWVRGWFKKGGKKDLVKKLENSPDSDEVKSELSKALADLSGDEGFRKQFELWIKESRKPNPTMKNVLEGADINVEGNIRIGDKEAGGDQNFDQKNVVKNSKIVGGGDFTLGDS